MSGTTWLPAVTAILFVAAIVLLFIEPQRALVCAVLFLACVVDPINEKLDQ